MSLSDYVVYMLLYLVGCLISASIAYRGGRKRGAAYVLREWKAFNREYFGKCPHDHEWEDCPDCRH